VFSPTWYGPNAPNHILYGPNVPNFQIHADDEKQENTTPVKFAKAMATAAMVAV
jgi:hypothetical protein